LPARRSFRLFNVTGTDANDRNWYGKKNPTCDSNHSYQRELIAKMSFDIDKDKGSSFKGGKGDLASTNRLCSRF
jgi:hypothetical protein